MSWIKYESVVFNAAWVKEQSFEVFAAHEAHHGFTAKQLREIYALCGGKVKPTKAQPSETEKGE